jgi:hypothetical protein
MQTLHSNKYHHGNNQQLQRQTEAPQALTDTWYHHAVHGTDFQKMLDLHVEEFGLPETEVAAAATTAATAAATTSGTPAGDANDETADSNVKGKGKGRGRGGKRKSTTSAGTPDAKKAKVADNKYIAIANVPGVEVKSAKCLVILGSCVRMLLCKDVVG